MADMDFQQQFPNNPSLMSEIDSAALSQTIPQGYVQSAPDPYSQQVVDAYNAQFEPKQTGMLGHNALYPGAGHNINVGTYSGSRIGANPIFVPGGNIMAIDPILERRKALDDAARLKASSIKPFTYQKPYQLKDARFQQSLSDQTEAFATKMIRDAQAKYGKDFGVVLSDQSTPEGRQFVQGMANFETLGKNFDQITDLMAGIEQGLKDKTEVYSPETLKQYQDFKTLVGKFANGDVDNSVDLASQYDRLKGMRSFENYIQSDGFLKDFQGKIDQNFYVNEAGDYFRTGTTKKVSYDDAINEVADSLAQYDFAPEIQAGLYSKEYLKKAIRARLKNQKISEGSIQQKTETTRGSEQVEEIPDPNTSINFYQKDKPGAADVYTYDKNGNRSGVLNLGILSEAQMRIVGSKKQIYERMPDGQLKKTDFNGIPLSNIQVVTGKGKTEEVPGNVYVELGELAKLDDGTVVQKARYTRPTTGFQVDKDKSFTDPKTGKKLEVGQNFDSYTFEDGYIVLEKGGQPTGAKTEIKQKIQSKESRERYDQAFDKVKQWNGEASKQNSNTDWSQYYPKGQTTQQSSGSGSDRKYQYQGDSWSYDELKGAGWTDEQIKSLQTY